MGFLSKIVAGYGGVIIKSSKTIATALKVVLFLLFVFSLSVLIVYPLWYLASNSPDRYSFMVIVVSITFFLSYLLFKFIRVIRNYGLQRVLKDLFLPKIKKLLLFIIIVFLILLSVYIYTLSLLFGLIISFFVLLLLGYIKFVYKN